MLELNACVIASKSGSRCSAADDVKEYVENRHQAPVRGMKHTTRKRQAERDTDKQRERETERDRQTNRKRETERETHAASCKNKELTSDDTLCACCKSAPSRSSLPTPLMKYDTQLSLPSPYDRP